MIGDVRRRRLTTAAVIKLAGDALAKRSKDLRLAGWLVESLFKRENFTVLSPGLIFLKDIQETFWDTVFPEKEEDGNLDMRVVAIESVANRLALALKSAPLTRSGFGLIEYTDSRAVGYEADAENSSDRAEARQYAIKHGRLTAEDFDDAFKATPKAFYVGVEKELVSALERTEELDQFQVEKYGDDYPSTSKLRNALEEVKQLVGSFLMRSARMSLTKNQSWLNLSLSLSLNRSHGLHRLRMTSLQPNRREQQRRHARPLAGNSVPTRSS